MNLGFIWRSVFTLVVGAGLLLAFRQAVAMGRANRGASRENVDREVRQFQAHGDALYWSEEAHRRLHVGPISQAFACFEQAIRHNPAESIYHHDLGTAMFLYRRDAMRYYDLDEQELYDRVMEQYRLAMKCDPANFQLAADVATTFYGIRPPRFEAARTAWQRALHLAGDPLQREGVYLHLARTELNGNRPALARDYLRRVNNPSLEEMKATLTRRLYACADQ